MPIVPPVAARRDGGAIAPDNACVFVVEDRARPGAARFCNAPCRPGSPYCPQHHARCHLPAGSAAEQHQLREIEALAMAAGGRHSRDRRSPPDHMLRRFERLAQTFLRR